jgi:zinc transporter 7
MKTVIILILITISLIISTYGESYLSLEKLAESVPLFSIWSCALSTTLLISIIPYLILFFIPLDNTPEYESMLKICLSLASGGLLGDAFLHLIPEAIMNGGNDQNHSLRVGLWILAGFMTFFLVEKMVRLAKSKTEIKHNERKQSFRTNESDINDRKISDFVLNNNSCDKICSNNTKISSNETECDKNTFSDVFKDIKIAGYLNLVADLTHNFTDGLAIGSSFLAGHNVGLVTGIAIMLHEIPHEIGDFAVLIKSGCSRTKAMQLQLLTAIGALTGTIVSLAIGGFSSDGTSWVLPFTGGGFIYIATVSIVPELTQESGLKQSIKELSALIIGIFIMTLIV